MATAAWMINSGRTRHAQREFFGKRSLASGQRVEGFFIGWSDEGQQADGPLGRAKYAAERECDVQVVDFAEIHIAFDVPGRD